MTEGRTQREAHTPNLVKTAVINLTTTELSQHQESLLNLGPKFVPAPNKVPVMDIITTTELEARNLDYKNKNTVAQTLRQDVMKTLKTAKPPKSNLTKEQRQALKELKSDNENAIYPFDKGSGLVMLPKETGKEKKKKLENRWVIKKLLINIQLMPSPGKSSRKFGKLNPNSQKLNTGIYTQVIQLHHVCMVL